MLKWQEEVDNVINEYGNSRSSLLPVLESIQKNLGYVPEETIRYVSNKLNIPMVDVYSTFSFYGLLKSKKEGKYAIKVCKSVSCYLKGAGNILKVLEEELGIKAGEKTEDGLFSIELVGCLGQCDKSPAILINEDVYTELTEEKVREIISNIKQEEGLV